MARPASSSGNAFVYVLIAVILFGGLTFALSKNQDSSPEATINDAAAKAAATRILAYEADAKNAIDNMLQSGANVDQIDFTLPSSGTFNTAPTAYKLFHPDGGGLQYKSLPRPAIVYPTYTPPNGFYVGIFNNFTWTPTTTNDVVFAAYGISKSVCEQLNLKIVGNNTVPVIPGLNIMKFFVDDVHTGLGNNSFTPAQCASCSGYPSMCVQNTGTWYSYYSLLVSR